MLNTDNAPRESGFTVSRYWKIRDSSFAAKIKSGFQFVGFVEVIFDGTLAAARNGDHVGIASGNSFFHRKLNNGLSTIGIVSFGLALVAGKKRVPIPATGKTALVRFFIVPSTFRCILDQCKLSTAHRCQRQVSAHIASISSCARQPSNLRASAGSA